MASERMRTLLPYVSIGIGILVYVLYYMSTQSWKQAQSNYERQLVEERQANQRANDKLVKETKPWISADGKEVYKIVSRKEKDGLLWIQLTELKKNTTYTLRKVESANGEKYTSNAGNLFWIKGKKGIFQNAEGRKSDLKTTQTFKGLYSYMADANTFKLCDDGVQISIAFLGENKNIEQEYSKINRPGEDVYLEIEGIMIPVMSMEGNELINVVYPYQIINMENRKTCE